MREYLASAVIGVMVYLGLSSFLGSPIVEWVTLAIFWLGPIAGGILVQGSLAKIRSQSPELYNDACERAKAIADATFDRSMI